MRIFLDANILFSAAKSDGAVRRLLTLLIGAGHSCCVDGYVAEEATRNLAVKARDGLPALDALLAKLEVAEVHPHAKALEAASVVAEKDRPVVAAAIAMQCDALVTGDRTHFGAWYGKSIGGVTIHSPASLAEETLTR
jgi:predicted nucleic acid-binding protein